MFDDAAMLLRHARQEAGHVLEREKGEVERVAEPDEPRALERRVDIQHAGEHGGLVGDHPDRAPSQTREPDEQVAGELPVHFEELAVVHDMPDHLAHIVRLRGAVGHDLEQIFVPPVHRIVAGTDRRAVEVVRRDEAEERPHCRQALRLGVVDEVRHAGGRPVHVGATQALEVHLLVRHRLHDVRAGDEHVGDPPHHEHEVGDGRAVDRPARARAKDGAQLRHHAGGEGVAQEDLGVATQRDDPLLDAGAARVVEPDDGSPVSHGEVHDLADLFRVRLGQGPAEHREVLREHVDQPPFDPPVARHDPVAQIPLVAEPEIGAAVRHEPIELHERPGIEQHVEPLAGGHLAFVVLRLDTVGSAAELGLGALLLQQLQLFAHCHGENLGAQTHGRSRGKHLGREQAVPAGSSLDLPAFQLPGGRSLSASLWPPARSGDGSGPPPAPLAPPPVLPSPPPPGSARRGCSCPFQRHLLARRRTRFQFGKYALGL